MSQREPSITQSIEQATKALLAGQLVAIPTETVYGLAADATNPDAVAKVFELKGRPKDHPLIVHCSSKEQAWQCASLVTSLAERLANAFWPGPLTVVVPRGDSIDPSITAGQDSVAVRVPEHPTTRQLLLAVGRPLVAPSANRFGRVSPTRAEHVMEEFPGSALLILDGGQCDVGIESTIVDCRSDDQVQILRPGKISPQDLIDELGADFVKVSETLRENVKVSGNLPSHYAPHAKVILLEPDELVDWCKDHRDDDSSTFLISTAQQPSDTPSKIHWHAIPKDVYLFAREIYSLFRHADRESFERIVVELPPAEGIGIALRDRLKRAAN